MFWKKKEALNLAPLASYMTNNNKLCNQLMLKCKILERIAYDLGYEVLDIEETSRVIQKLPQEERTKLVYVNDFAGTMAYRKIKKGKR